jgi:hypothetical protein
MYFPFIISAATSSLCLPLIYKNKLGLEENK